MAPSQKLIAHSIIFDPEKHLFTCAKTGQKYTSVTTLIGDFFPKFDADKIAEQCAIKRGVDKQDLINQWTAEAKRGSTEGTNVHEYAEWRINFVKNGNCGSESPPKPISDRAHALFQSVNVAVDSLSQSYRFIATEKIIFDPEYRVAGIVDLIVKDKNDNYIILDWKQNKVISETNKWEKGIQPIAHLEASDLVKYQLQLSLYAHILKAQNYYPDCKHIRLGLIHLLPHKVPRFIKIGPLYQEIKSILSVHRYKFL